MSVSSVEGAGGQLPFVQLNGEILVDLPEGFDGDLRVNIDSEIALTSGAQSHSGPTYLYQPVGHMFDVVDHKVMLSGQGELVASTSQPVTDVGSIEPPALAIGKYITLTTEAAGTPVEAMAFEHQVFTGAAHAGQSRESLNIDANEGGAGGKSFDTGSNATQSSVNGDVRSKVFASDAATTLKIYNEVLGPLSAPKLTVAQARGFHPAMTANVAAAGMMTLAESELFFFDVSGQEATLYIFQAQAYELSRQWVGVSVAVGDELADFYFFDGLRRYLSAYALEQARATNPFLDSFLDLTMRWAVRTEQGGRKVQLGFDSGWETMGAGAEARGYLLFNNLRYAVGEQAMNKGLKAAFGLLQGEPAYSDDLVNALETAFSMDLSPLFSEGVALATYAGSIDVAYHIEGSGAGSVLTATATPNGNGPSLGATVRLTFTDMSEGILFVPFDQAISTVLPMGVRKVEGFRRGSGLARRVSVDKAGAPLK